mgnify:CR=1 FL=1
MYCMLKSQIDGKPFLVTAINSEADIERIGHFVWALQQLEIASGSSTDIAFGELPNIIKGDYSAKAYKRRLREIELLYSRKRWYEGMIERLEREESERGQSEI